MIRSRSSSAQGSMVLSAVLVASLVLCLLGGTPAGATTYIMTTDDELLDRATVVVLARVLSSEVAPTELPSTDYLVEIEQLVKGFVPAGTVLVRTPGGLRPDGSALHVTGVPALSPNERVVLFLTPGEAGTFGLVELGLGAFQEVTTPGFTLAMRSLSSSREVVLPNDPAAAERRRSHQPRDLEKFVSWLSDRADGSDREPDYFTNLPDAGIYKAITPFTFTMTGGQCPQNRVLRHNQFDQGQAVGFTAFNGGQPNVPGGGFTEIRQALQLWSSISNSNVNLRWDGTTGNTNGFITSDLINNIVFEDGNDQVPGTYTGGGGTLAVGTVFFGCNRTHSYGGGVANDIVEAGIVTQDGVGQFFFGVQANPAISFAEIIAHELGHTIGLGHSCGDSDSPPCSGVIDDALMNAFVHNDGRGARLNSDDRAAIRTLYPTSANNDPPNAPTQLTASAISTSEILLSWADNSNDESGFEIEERTITGAFAPLMTVPADNTSATIMNISAATFRAYRVRAVNSAGVSGYSNEASATTSTTPNTCVENTNTLCLNQDRYQLTANYMTNNGGSGAGNAVELTEDTGYFWFFNSDNVEAVVKVLNGCFAPFNSYWVFAGGLTDVQVILTVVDTQNGAVKTYFNPLGTPFAPIQDTGAFSTCP